MKKFGLFNRILQNWLIEWKKKIELQVLFLRRRVMDWWYSKEKHKAMLHEMEGKKSKKDYQYMLTSLTRGNVVVASCSLRIGFCNWIIGWLVDSNNLVYSP
jgi:hypothetical protein